MSSDDAEVVPAAGVVTPEPADVASRQSPSLDLPDPTVLSFHPTAPAPSAAPPPPPSCESNRTMDSVEDEQLSDGRGWTGVYTGPVIYDAGKGRESMVPHTLDSVEEGTMVYQGQDSTIPVLKFVGTWQHGYWSQGKLWFTTGDIYVGQFNAQGIRHDDTGEARYEWTDGRLYIGQFVQGQRHGTGYYQWGASSESTSQRYYQGEFQSNQRHGKGVYVDQIQQVRYEGDFCGGMYEGQGVFTYPVKVQGQQDRIVVYSGEFQQGRPHGYGLEKWDSVDSPHVRHEGQWYQGRPVLAGTGVHSGALGAVPATADASQIQSSRAIAPPSQLASSSSATFAIPPPSSAVQPTLPSPAETTVILPPTAYWDDDADSTVMTDLDGVPLQPPQFESHTTVVQNQPWYDPVAGYNTLYRGVWDTVHQCPTGHGTVEYQLADAPANGGSPAPNSATVGSPNGNSTTDASNLRLYEGCFGMNGKFHGHGRLFWMNGDVYEGQFIKGQRHGPGTYRWVDGRVYTGDFVRNARRGYGTYLYPW
jgi:hypothetical protein